MQISKANKSINLKKIRSNYDFLEKARANEWNDAKSIQARVIAMHQLEEMMKTQFGNTQDFKKKMSDHFKVHPYTENEQTITHSKPF